MSRYLVPFIAAGASGKTVRVRSTTAETTADYSYISSESFDLHTDNGAPSGISVTSTRVYVVDIRNDKVYVYNLSGTRQTSEEFNLHSSNGNPSGIFVTSTRVYVVDDGTDKVFVYSLSTTTTTKAETISIGNVTYTVYPSTSGSSFGEVIRRDVFKWGLSGSYKIPDPRIRVRRVEIAGDLNTGKNDISNYDNWGVLGEGYSLAWDGTNPSAPNFYVYQLGGVQFDQDDKITALSPVTFSLSHMLQAWTADYTTGRRWDTSAIRSLNYATGAVSTSVSNVASIVTNSRVRNIVDIVFAKNAYWVIRTGANAGSTRTSGGEGVNVPSTSSSVRAKVEKYSSSWVRQSSGDFNLYRGTASERASRGATSNYWVGNLNPLSASSDGRYLYVFDGGTVQAAGTATNSESKSHLGNRKRLLLRAYNQAHMFVYDLDNSGARVTSKEINLADGNPFPYEVTRAGRVRVDRDNYFYSSAVYNDGSHNYFMLTNTVVEAPLVYDPDVIRAYQNARSPRQFPTTTGYRFFTVPYIIPFPRGIVKHGDKISILLNFSDSTPNDDSDDFGTQGNFIQALRIDTHNAADTSSQSSPPDGNYQSGLQAGAGGFGGASVEDSLQFVSSDGIVRIAPPNVPFANQHILIARPADQPDPSVFRFSNAEAVAPELLNQKGAFTKQVNKITKDSIEYNVWKSNKPITLLEEISLEIGVY